jgi:hypothetical protein
MEVLLRENFYFILEEDFFLFCEKINEDLKHQRNSSGLFIISRVSQKFFKKNKNEEKSTFSFSSLLSD